MANIRHTVVNVIVDVVWRLRPKQRHAIASTVQVSLPQTATYHEDNTASLRGLIQRFPFWKRGRLILAEAALSTNDIALAYAESHAVLSLARKGSKLYTNGLTVLGSCFLRRGDSKTALTFLNEAHSHSPNDLRIQEERAAALILDGDRAQALSILRALPPEKLSAESKAALAWLSTGSLDSHN